LYYSPDNLENLIKDIEKTHLREPIGVRLSPSKKDMYQIIYGFHRVKAFIKLGKLFIKAYVYKLNDKDAGELSVRDNEMHKDLTDIERAFQCLRMRNNHSIEELERIYNAKRRTIYNWLEVAIYSQQVTIDLVALGRISFQHAHTLVKKEYKDTIKYLRDALCHNLSVRQLKALIKNTGFRVKMPMYPMIKVCPRYLTMANVLKTDNPYVNNRLIHSCEECEYFDGYMNKEGETTKEHKVYENCLWVKNKKGKNIVLLSTYGVKATQLEWYPNCGFDFSCYSEAIQKFLEDIRYELLTWLHISESNIRQWRT